MKTRKNLLLILLFFTTIVVALIISSCSAEQPNVAEQEAYINCDVSQYSNYDFWEKENELRLLGYKQSDVERKKEVQQAVIFRLAEPTEEQSQYIMEMREGIIAYFLTVHKIDISNELKEQEVMFYESVEEDEALGYINPNNTDIIMMNVETTEVGEQSCLFNEIYINLTLKTLGFESETAEVLTEGIRNSLTERILNFMSKSLTFRDNYENATKIAHQLLEADPEIVKCYLGEEKTSIIDKINEKIKNVPRVYYEEFDPAVRMENILAVMEEIWNGETVVLSDEPHALLFEAQEIAIAYCKQCHPSTEVIDYIRTKYIINDFENLEVLIDQDRNKLSISNR